jgi:hypothetical protein
MTSWEFPVSGPIAARIRVPAGTIDIVGEPTQTATVSLRPDNPLAKGGDKLVEATQVSFDDGILSVMAPERVRLFGHPDLDVKIVLPEGSDVSVHTASADLRCTGELHLLNAETASGDVIVDRLSGPADIETASGDVRVAEAAGNAQFRTASGSVHVGRADGEVTANSASGDVTIKQAERSVVVKTASGDIEVSGLAEGESRLTSMSGDITAAVRRGVGVYLDLNVLSGDVSSELDPGEGDGQAALTLRCTSVSGDVRAIRADPVDR